MEFCILEEKGEEDISEWVIKFTASSYGVRRDGNSPGLNARALHLLGFAFDTSVGAGINSRSSLSAQYFHSSILELFSMIIGSVWFCGVSSIM